MLLLFDNLKKPPPNGSITTQPLNSVYFNGTDSHYVYPATAQWNFPNSDWSLGFLCNVTFGAAGILQHFVGVGTTASTNRVRIYLDNTTWVAQVSPTSGVVTVTSSTPEASLAPSASYKVGDPRWMLIVLRRNGANLELVKCPMGGTATVLNSAVFTGASAITPLATFPPMVGVRTTDSTFLDTTRVRNHIAYVFKMDSLITDTQMQNLAAGQTFAAAGVSPVILTHFSSAAATITNSGTGGSNTATRVGTPSSRGGAVISGMPVAIDAASDAVWAKVHNRAPGATSRSVSFSGTYTGAPSGIEARVISGEATAVTSWIACATPSAGVWNVTIPNIPQGGKYALEVRHKNNPANLARTTRPWGVGINIIIAGESLGDQQFNNGNATTAYDREMVTSYDTADGWYYSHLITATQGAGSGEILSALSNALNIPIGVFNGSSSGSRLIGAGGWSNPATAMHTKYLSALAAAGDAEAIIWVQGANDAGFATATPAAVSQSAYQTDLEALIPVLRGYHTGFIPAQLPVFINPLGRTTTVLTSATDNWRNIRNAHVAAVGNIANAHIGATLHDAALVDSVHPTVAAYNIIGRRQAQALLNYYAPGSFATGTRGAQPISATFSGSVITITFQLNNGATLRGLTGATGLTGFDVRNGGGVLQTISSTAIPTATTVTLTMAAAPAAGWTVDYVPLSAVDITNLLYTDAPVINIATNQTVPARAWAAPITL